MAWMSSESSRAAETTSSPASSTQEQSSSEGDAPAAKRDTKIVVSDFTSGVVHKKFDKFRKTSPQPPVNVEKEKNESAASTVASPSTSDGQPSTSSSSDGEKSAKPSAAEAHPQLMAHLQAPPPAIATPFTSVGSLPLRTSQSAYDSHVTPEPQVVMAMTKPNPVLSNMTSQDGGLIGNRGNKPLTEAEEKNLREQVHQTTMLSLKDKLLKKIDSMDNLMKISNGEKPASKREPAKAPAASTVPPTTAVLTSQPPHTMYAPSPVYSRQIPLYPPYYGLRYPAMPGMPPMMPQGAYPQPVPGMPHIAQMYSSSMPHLR